LTGASGAALSLALLMPAGAAFAQAADAPVAANPKPASPQATGAASEVGTVVVTGSRIANRNAVSSSPIVTLNSSQLVQQADLQIQNTLNKLPQFAPSQNLLGTQTADVQPTPTHSVGIATASLRGLGSNRNLVLIDGRRGAPVNGSLVVDLSTIPTSMIDHVETITGGASAVYGADAVAGVVNFVMKKNFQGVDLDTQFSRNETGDGNQFTFSAVAGANFADDKGNITFSMERLQQDATLQNTHEFYKKGWADPTVGTNALFGFAGGWATSINGPTVAAMNQAFPNGNGMPYNTFGGSTVNNTTIYATGAGVYTGFAGTNSAGNYAYPYKLNGTSVAPAYYVDSVTHSVVTGVKNNFINGYIQSPLDRWSFFTNGHYDFNDDISAYFQANFARSHTDTVLAAPISAVNGWDLTVPYDVATGGAASGHPVPTALAQLLNSRTNPNANWEVTWTPNPNGPIPPRSTDDTNTVFQITAGLKGKLPGNHDFAQDWTWDVYGSHSESQQYTVAGGDWSLARYQALVGAPNWGAGAVLQGNIVQPNGQPSTRPAFGSAKITCTSGFYNAIFNGGALSQDCLNAINAPLQSMDTTKQDVVEADLQGTAVHLPTGDLKFSLGADYRRDSLVYNPDILQSTNSFTDQVIGVYPTAYTNASTDVKEVYGELQIPILANLPLIKAFTFNPGVRYSDYSASPSNWTYKFMGDWEVNDFLRFRGGFNLAVRAPNVGELYLGQTEVFGGGSSYADACSLASNAPWGAGGAAPLPNNGGNGKLVNTNGLAGATNALAICKALMSRNSPVNQATGQSQSVGTFYGNAQASTASPFAWVYQVGSPDVQPETARTVTAGMVLTSPWRDNPYLSRARLSVDYYRIRIDDAIEFVSMDYLYRLCLGSSGVAAALANPACASIQRDPTSGSDSLDVTPAANLATIDTAGIDIQADWAVALSDIYRPIPGNFAVNVAVNILDHYDTKSDPYASWIRWKGTLGPNLTGLDAGAYAWRLNTNFAYTVGPAMVGLGWRHLPRVAAVNSVLAGNGLPTDAWDVFDLNASLSLPHGMQLRAGIQNLLDTEPGITGATSSVYLNGQIQSLGSSMGTGGPTTNAGYYDALGRRFYIGLKARF
jgi:outer membrane receptor protein involved in Fe transport